MPPQVLKPHWALQLLDTRARAGSFNVDSIRSIVLSATRAVHEQANIPLVDLLLDVNNPRLADAQATQQDTALELARQQGDGLTRLAADIVEEGLDPTTLTAVVATGDRRKRYKILEGNRRVLALRALETPSLVTPVLSPRATRRLNQLAKKYEQNPIETVPCVLFDSEDDAQHWIRLRHTGENQGVGLVAWGAEEQDRYFARHAGTRKPAGQLIEFVEKHGFLSDAAKASKHRILTNVERVLETPAARQKLGVDVRQKQVIALYPVEEIARSLTHFIEDLKLQRVGVPDLYKAKDRERYVDALPSGVLPKRSKKLDVPVLLDGMTAGEAAPKPARRSPRRKKRTTRTTVIPKTATLDVTPSRINLIYNELLSLNAEQYQNACSVLLRVFIELSVDHVIAERKLLTDQALRNAALAKKLKLVVKSLKDAGEIPAKLATAIDAIADGQRNILAASIFNFNQYVHNQYVYPRAADLYTTWDELAPFMEKLWPQE